MRRISAKRVLKDLGQRSVRDAVAEMLVKEPHEDCRRDIRRQIANSASCADALGSPGDHGKDEMPATRFGIALADLLERWQVGTMQDGLETGESSDL
jgi:hypothetical protein